MYSENRILKQIDQRVQQSKSKVKNQINTNQNEGKNIQELDLDYISIVRIKKQIKLKIQGCLKITYLTMNYCDIVSLQNFPKLLHLQILQLSNNKIKDDQLFHLLPNSGITHLMLNDNLLRSVQKVSVLRQLPSLHQLQLCGNLIGQTDFYRDQIFERIVQLKILDCHDKQGNQVVESQSQDQSINKCNNENQSQQDSQFQQDDKCSVYSGLRKAMQKQLQQNQSFFQKQKQFISNQIHQSQNISNQQKFQIRYQNYQNGNKKLKSNNNYLFQNKSIHQKNQKNNFDRTQTSPSQNKQLKSTASDFYNLEGRMQYQQDNQKQEENNNYIFTK